MTLGAPGTVGAPLVPDVLTGLGTAASFQLSSVGVAIQGGVVEWTDVCAGCLLRIGLREGTFLVTDAEGVARQLTPGVYEMREYRGFFLFSQRGPHDFAVQLYGLAKIERLG